MAAKKTTRTTPAAATLTPIDAATVAAVRTMLNDAVQAYITLLEQASDEMFTATWELAMQPTAAFWAAYLLLPQIAFPDDLPPDQRLEPILMAAPFLLAPTLAALAFAPGGLRFGLTTWQGRHPAASRVIRYRVTDDDNGGWLALPVQPGGSFGGRTPLHRRTVQTLHLLFPFKATELLRLPDAERFTEAQRIARSYGPESLLFSEALPAGGMKPAEMGQAVKELVEVVAALGCVPWGVPMFGYRWELLSRVPANEAADGGEGVELEPVAVEGAA